MHLLLTGAFGFVGLNLLRGLASQPDVTIAAADVRSPDPSALAFLAPVLQRLRVLRLDVTDRAAVQAAVAAEAPTHILHAAALTPTRDQEAAAPAAIVDVNLGGALNVLEAVRHAPQVERVLLVSSSGVYGAPPPGAGPVQGEEGPLALGSLYAMTKVSAELLAARYRQLSNQWIASLRLSAIYGPMEEPSASRPQISQVGALLQALRAKRPVKVAGPDVCRDWTYADDIAGAVWALFTAERWRYDIYNVSCGRAVSFQTVVETFVQHGLAAEWVENVAGADIAMHPDQARLPLDISRLREDTGFTPQLDFAKGIARLAS
jgi:nucleoside-diphosphate-sugar epimerase